MPHHRLLQGSGTKVFTFGQRLDDFTVPAAPDQQGTLGKFTNPLGHRIVLSVPPSLARAGRDLLLPGEVGLADRTK